MGGLSIQHFDIDEEIKVIMNRDEDVVYNGKYFYIREALVNAIDKGLASETIPTSMLNSLPSPTVRVDDFQVCPLPLYIYVYVSPSTIIIKLHCYEPS